VIITKCRFQQGNCQQASFLAKIKNVFLPFPEMADGEKYINLDHKQQASVHFETGIPTGRRNLMTKQHSFSELCPSPCV
jgi:hypothetical protein